MRLSLSRRTMLGIGVAAGLAAGAPAVLADDDDDRGRGGDPQVVGIAQDTRNAGQQFIRFDADDPQDAERVGRVGGLVGDTKLVGIDFRPSRGTLWGLGDRGGVYEFTSSTTGVKRSQVNVPLEGTSFGVDFNPVPDRLRIISDTGQNLRDNVDANGDTIVDGRLTNSADDSPATGVTGAAYTNNDSAASTATTLFDIDTAMDQVEVQSPANAGTLAPTGALGVDTNAVTGSDIFATVERGAAVKNRAFAGLNVSGRSRFYEVDVLTGRADRQGDFPSRFTVEGIAVELDRDDRDRDDDDDDRDDRDDD